MSQHYVDVLVGDHVDPASTTACNSYVYVANKIEPADRFAFSTDVRILQSSSASTVGTINVDVGVTDYNPSEIHVWDGSQWVHKPVYEWDGSSWQEIT